MELQVEGMFEICCFALLEQVERRVGFVSGHLKCLFAELLQISVLGCGEEVHPLGLGQLGETIQPDGTILKTELRTSWKLWFRCLNN